MRSNTTKICSYLHNTVISATMLMGYLTYVICPITEWSLTTYRRRSIECHVMRYKNPYTIVCFPGTVASVRWNCQACTATTEVACQCHDDDYRLDDYYVTPAQ